MLKTIRAAAEALNVSESSFFASSGAQITMLSFPVTVTIRVGVPPGSP